LCSYSLQQCDATTRTPLWGLTALPQADLLAGFWGEEGVEKGKGEGKENGTKGSDEEGKKGE